MLAISVTGVIASSLQAADHNADFVTALRANGWDDTAVEYLEWVAKSPLMTPAFAQQLPYQRALSLSAHAKQIKNRSERERVQAEAAIAFEQYATEQPDSPTALEALRESANLYAGQALSTLVEAQRLPDQAAAQKEQAQQAARERFAKAAAATERLISLCTDALAALPKAAAAQADPETKSRRDLLRDRQVEAQFLHARITFEAAAANTLTSDEHNEALNAASREFGELVEAYRGSVVGDTSRYYQGRCAQELGAYEKALGCYKDALGTPSANPEFRRLKARVHRRQAECLIATDKIDEAIECCEDWLASSQPAERQQPEWLEVAYTLAQAVQQQAEAAETASSAAKQLTAKARALYRDVSQQPNEFQNDARLALAALGQPATSSAELKTFADASAAGKQALELWNSSTLAMKLARENNPEAAAELEDQAAAQKADALRAFERALEVADRQTPIEEVNEVRYFLAILYWEHKQIYEAAVLGEFLAKRYPENENAANAAKIAMAAYEQAAVEAQADAAHGGSASKASPSASFASRKLAELAELMASRWPESQEGASAVNVLIQTALRENRLSDAEALLARLPPDGRSAAQLSLGAGLWTRYLRATAGQNGAPSDEAVAAREKAGHLLKSGFAGLRERGAPTPAAAAATLYYVQYLLATGDAAGAVEAIEDEGVGPLTLVESQSPAASRSDYVLETYKAALRAYLSVQPPQPEKAQRMMAALDKFAGEQDGAAAAKTLTDIYLGLGVQLQRQMQEFTATGRPEQARHVAEAFGHVLERVARRPDADSWQIRSWLAQMNLQIGKSLTDDDAKVYADRAREAFEAMLAAAAKDSEYAPDANAVLAVRMRLGECLAAEGQFQQAIEHYAEILRERPNTLDLQLAAAAALQSWGVAKRDPAVIERSIRGDMAQADGKNLIWGWLRLATMAQQASQQAASGAIDAATRQRVERFRDLFFEARYNIARSRFLAASVTASDKRLQQLQAAKANIEQMRLLYPDLGGDKWKGQFEQLLEQINQELAK